MMESGAVFDFAKSRERFREKLTALQTVLAKKRESSLEQLRPSSCALMSSAPTVKIRGESTNEGGSLPSRPRDGSFERPYGCSSSPPVHRDVAYSRSKSGSTRHASSIPHAVWDVAQQSGYSLGSPTPSPVGLSGREGGMSSSRSPPAHVFPYRSWSVAYSESSRPDASPPHHVLVNPRALAADDETAFLDPRTLTPSSMIRGSVSRDREAPSSKRDTSSSPRGTVALISDFPPGFGRTTNRHSSPVYDKCDAPPPGIGHSDPPLPAETRIFVPSEAVETPRPSRHSKVFQQPTQQQTNRTPSRLVAPAHFPGKERQLPMTHIRQQESVDRQLSRRAAPVIDQGRLHVRRAEAEARHQLRLKQRSMQEAQRAASKKARLEAQLVTVGRMRLPQHPIADSHRSSSREPSVYESVIATSGIPVNTPVTARSRSAEPKARRGQVIEPFRLVAPQRHEQPQPSSPSVSPRAASSEPRLWSPPAEEPPRRVSASCEGAGKQTTLVVGQSSRAASNMLSRSPSPQMMAATSPPRRSHTPPASPPSYLSPHSLFIHNMALGGRKRKKSSHHFIDSCASDAGEMPVKPAAAESSRVLNPERDVRKFSLRALFSGNSADEGRETTGLTVVPSATATSLNSKATHATSLSSSQQASDDGDEEANEILLRIRSLRAAMNNRTEI